MNGTRFDRWKNSRARGALLCVLATASCITRGGESSGANTPGAAENTVAALPPDTEEPTGNYGKVAGVELVGDKGVKSLALMGKKERVELSWVPVEGQPFSEAIQAKITEKSGQTWDVQMATKALAPVAAGDVMLASFYMRTEWTPDETAEGVSEFVFELAKEPYPKSISYPVRASGEWKKYYIPFRAAQSYAVGDAQLIFRLGYPPQTIQIADFKIENFKRELVMADLPITKITYGGSEPDAAWRAAAQARIEKIRKAPIHVVVQDASGKALPGAMVKVSLTRHRFGFGTAAAARSIIHGDPEYRKILLENFNAVTLENDLKWVALAGDYGDHFSMAQAKRALDWLQERDMPVRGHVLVWPSWRNMPMYVKRLKNDPEALRAEVTKRITSVLSATKGRLPWWDVLNEPFDNHDLMDIFGNEIMVDWFKLARELEPNAELFINDYAILSGGGTESPHRDHYEKTIQYLVDNGAPLDGIGLQGHFGGTLTAPTDLLKLLDRYGKFGKKIWVTEYDITIDDEELAAQYTKDLYTTLFSHPAVAGVIMWVFRDKDHWRKNAVMYRDDWSLKPAGRVYKELYHKTWRTNEAGVSDAQGRFATRGFLGEYLVEVSAPGKKTKKVKATIAAQGGTVAVKLQ